MVFPQTEGFGLHYLPGNNNEKDHCFWDVATALPLFRSSGFRKPPIMSLLLGYSLGLSFFFSGWFSGKRCSDNKANIFGLNHLVTAHCMKYIICLKNKKLQLWICEKFEIPLNEWIKSLITGIRCFLRVALILRYHNSFGLCLRPRVIPIKLLKWHISWKILVYLLAREGQSNVTWVLANHLLDETL